MKVKEDIQSEVTRIQNHLGSVYAGATSRTTQKVAKQILLEGWYFYNGRMCVPKAKSAGCGVWEISLE